MKEYAENYNITPIAHIYTDFNEKFGIPRQSGRAPSITGKIVFVPQYSNSDALRGIEKFSHLWLIFDFSLSHKQKFSPTVRPPRLGGNERVGVFASRSPFRPNSLGLSIVKLLKIEDSEQGKTLIVSGADILNGTPIFDIKPYIPYADCITDASGGYAEEHCKYKLKIIFLNDSEKIIPEDKINALIECLSDDPRPSYHNDDRQYGMTFAGYNIRFFVENQTIKVTQIIKEER